MNYKNNFERIKKEVKTCERTGKQCLSRRDAGELINVIKKGKRTGGRNHVPKRAYYCEHCGCYHLTHKPEIKNRKKRIWSLYDE